MAAPARIRMITNSNSLSGTQRAALLLMYLDGPVAKSILQHMSTDEIQNIGLAIAEVEQVDPMVVEEVVATFVRDLHAVSMVPKTGEDFALNVLPDLIDDSRRPRVANALRRQLSTQFIEYLRSRPANTIATVLMDEHPQTQAIGLLLMGPEIASEVMKLFDPQERYEMSMRMARIKNIPGELADDVETAMCQALEDTGTDRYDIPGLDRTAQILGRLDLEAQEGLLEQISDEDEKLSAELRRRMVVFADLGRMNDRSVQTLLKHTDRETLQISLRGADFKMRDLFFRNMSRRAAADLQDELEIMQPVPRSRVEEAQEEMVQTAMRLKDEGLLTLPLGGSDDELV